jgi:hypothetical protein
MEIADLGKIAATRTRAVAAELESVQPSGETISLQLEFSTLNNRPKLDQFLNRPVSIYSFHLTNDDVRDEFIDVFRNAKASSLAGLAYPRLNKNVADLSADCLYVGTSRKTVQRLMEHLGFGSDRTYSLHLGKWATNLSGGIEMRVHPFLAIPSKLHLLTYLEDALAEHLRPMLGRRGNL